MTSHSYSLSCSGRVLTIAAVLCWWLGPTPALAADGDAEGQTPAAVAAPPPPMTIKMGEVELKIGGFIDAVGLLRTTNVGSGLATAFGAIPVAESPAGNLRETRFTSQGSRVNLLAATKVGNAAVRAYLEIDFLGVQTPNALVTTNANGPRMRHSYMQVRTGKFEFVGGQAWSLMTPNRVGLSPTPADIFFSQTIDPNSHVGNTWSRVAQFRFVAHATSAVTAGVSLENPQQYVGPGVVLPLAFPAGEVDNNANSAAPNPFPDVIGKVAFDPQTGGTRQHVEVALLVRGFKTFEPTTSETFSKVGRAASINVNFEPIKNVHLIATSFFSEGGGRYAIGLAPDLIVNADGSPTLVKARSYLAGVEAGVKKALLFGYYGNVHADAAVALDRNGTRLIGYGVPGSLAANRDIDEATAGAIYTIWRKPLAGLLQMIVQYSYLTRTPWSPPAGTEPEARVHMLFTTVRYTLP